MGNQSRYTLNIRLRNLSYEADGYKKSAIELHCHHFDTFDESFAYLLSLDATYFNERMAVRRRSAISMESADINDNTQKAADEPTIVTAMKGGDSPLINEPPGLYYIMWNGAGNFSREYGISFDDFTSYNSSHMLLPVARFDTKTNEVKTDPAFDRLKHRFLQHYLTEKKYYLSTLSIASNLDLPGEWNFNGRIIDAWHFNSLPQATTAFLTWDMQKLDAGYCSITGEHRYYEGLRLCEERGEELLLLTTNIYERDLPVNTQKGFFLHCNKNTPFGQFIMKRLNITQDKDDGLLVVSYDNAYQSSGPTNAWLQFQSAMAKYKDGGSIKRRSRLPTTTTAKTKTGIKQ